MPHLLVKLCYNFLVACFMFRFRGFTKFNRTDYLRWKEENRIVPDGVNAKVC